jgi:hypothetical protein
MESTTSTAAENAILQQIPNLLKEMLQHYDLDEKDFLKKYQLLKKTKKKDNDNLVWPYILEKANQL